MAGKQRSEKSGGSNGPGSNLGPFLMGHGRVEPDPI